MKNNKPLIIIAIILLNVLVVYIIGQSLLGKASSYDLKVAEAREYADKELCSKAIAAYDEALIMKDSLSLRLEMIDVYKRGLEIGEFTNTYDVVTAVTLAVAAYRNDPKVYEAACDLFLEYGKYEDCANILMKARDLHVSSSALTEYLSKVRYQYVKYYAMYTDVLPGFDNTYTVASNGTYTFLNDEASPNMRGGYIYATSFSNGYAFVQTLNANGSVRSFVINKKGERQAYYDVETSSGVGKATDKDGNALLLLACKVGESYKYFDLDGNELFGDYKFAGRFRNGVAAVQEKNGDWKFINGTGKAVTDKTFSDVVLNEFDECAPRGFVFAKDGDKYYLYDYKEIKQIGDFSCDGAKAFVSDIAAFKSGDLWGFVDTTGKIVIEAKYEDAKSFSNQLGAIYGGGSWKFINSEGEVVIDETFEDVNYLSDIGICFVKTKGYWSYLKFYYTGK